MHGFPVVLTSYVGRARAVDEIAGVLGQYRLVTVTGPGGAGKTRLAGEAATEAAKERGTAMSLATAAEYALMLAAAKPERPAADGADADGDSHGPGQRPRSRAWAGSARGNENWSRWSRRAAPTRKSRPSCMSPCARSARTWTGSGTRPAAAVAPTSPGWPLLLAWSD
jgi:hypothetical protein